jgi:hypothetical protein
MPARLSYGKVAAGLTVPERVLLFCLASNTDTEGRRDPRDRATDDGPRPDRSRRRQGLRVDGSGRAVLRALLEER